MGKMARGKGDGGMHPLGIAIEAARANGLDFFVIVGGDPEVRSKMGLPASVAREQPLLLAFQAAYHQYSKPTGDEYGLTCSLSFDVLYNCRIPWSTIKRLIIQNPADEVWPTAWDEENEVQPTEPPPDNVRPFRPRTR